MDEFVSDCILSKYQGRIIPYDNFVGAGLHAPGVIKKLYKIKKSV